MLTIANSTDKVTDKFRTPRIVVPPGIDADKVQSRAARLSGHQRAVQRWKEPQRRPSQRRKAVISLYLDLICALCAVTGLSAQAREFLELLLAISEGERFIAISDKKLIARLMTKENISEQAARKRIQRGRAALLRDEKTLGFTLIGITPGDRVTQWTPDGPVEIYLDSEYELAAWDILTDAYLIAAPELRLTTDRGRIFQAAIAEVLPDHGCIAPHRSHKRKRTPSKADLHERDKTTFRNAARRIYDYLDGTPEDRIEQLKELLAEAINPDTGDDSSVTLLQKDQGDARNEASGPTVHPPEIEPIVPAVLTQPPPTVKMCFDGPATDNVEALSEPAPPRNPSGQPLAEFIAEQTAHQCHVRPSKVDEWLSLAEIRNYDPSGGRGPGKRKRYCCPLCRKSVIPDHRDLSVDVETGGYRCFACGATGKLREWCDDVRVAVAPRTFFVPVLATHTQQDNRWRKWYQQAQPLTDTKGARYLRRRGIPLDVATYAAVHFAPNYLDGSVFFPLCNQAGDLVAVNARAITGDAKRTHGEKSAGVFRTGPDAFTAERVAITEAPIDALALAAAGLPAIALCGTSWPDWLPELLAGREVLLATDADDAGDKCAAKLAAELLGLATRWRLRPQGGKDWAEIAGRWGIETVAALIEGDNPEEHDSALVAGDA